MVSRAIELPLVHPHGAELEIEHCKRKRRDPPIAAHTFGVQPHCPLRLAAFRMERSQGAKAFKAWGAMRSFLADGKGFVIPTKPLKDCSTLAIHHIGIGAEPFSNLEILQGIGEAVEYRPGLGPREKCRCSRDGDMYQPIRELLRPLIVRDSAHDRAAQREQVDEPDPLVNRRATLRCLGLKARDLRLEIA